ncbi:uncharacterized protein BXZ73DRAFT_91934 [Epithele typhae]|uniref:uncharacterized protein n=1 Tax=Epithele typhae TaxID=378194 RepID=UPI00200739C8|nr:uncharacterized protein BXZ73DRAFT_91934 [Epithele typhae]KAH9920191.1 hypothetical protein BXZ73DRAFT_91934 [Epithele typhae]
MSLKALFYAYILGGLTLLPLAVLAAVFYTVYTSVPVGDADPDKLRKRELQLRSQKEHADADAESSSPSPPASASPSDNDNALETNDAPRPRRGWLTVRRTFEEPPTEGSYVELVRGFLDGRSKDPRRARPKDAWFAALKGTVLYLYEDEGMGECGAAVDLAAHRVGVHPEGLPDGELFAKRNAICLRPRADGEDGERERERGDAERDEGDAAGGRRRRRGTRRGADEAGGGAGAGAAADVTAPWFIFVRSAVEMEDWYLALVHASREPAHRPTLAPLRAVYRAEDMAHLVATLDEQPDVIPMRWLNALLGRVFFSYYRTAKLEEYIIGRLMKKISKVKRPGFLTDINVRDVSVGDRAPTFSKPMLKELTKEGDAALEVHVAYKGQVRITVEATATINLGAFAGNKVYNVKLVLALVLREIEGNLLIKVKRPPSSRIWYAFTQEPHVVLDVEPVVSDRQITWSMILNTVQSKLKEVILESVVLPNMDDISFFDSEEYANRGGIWADAYRRERAPTLAGEPTGPPPEEASRVDTGEPGFPPMQRSHSANETSGTSPPDGAPMVRATTVEIAGSSGSSSSAKRRTWFGSAQDADTSTPSDTPVPDEPVSRGRSLGPEVTNRPASVPNSRALEEPEESAVLPSDEVPESQYLSARNSTRRASSSSQHFRSNSSRDVSDDAPDAQTATYRPKSPAANGGSSRQTPTSPSGFFQTLKTRAADKQALSNTAKEAMRKWGVNWSNFRRESISGGSAGALSGDDVPDGGHGDQSRADGRAPGAACVLQRRERERPPLQETSWSNQLAMEPVPVPNGKGKARAESVPPANAPLPAPPALDDPASAKQTAAAPRAESPVPLERTESQASASSQHSKPAPIANVEPEALERPATTIHTQPLPPKTMMIPGIHAKNRGEVMSMGYAPPPPAPPQDTKKAPLQLQNMYSRLWKAPANGAPPQHEDAAPVSQTGFAGHDQDSIPVPSSSAEASGGRGEIPALPPAALQAQLPTLPQPARVPPPLPPRANSTHALLAKPEISRPSEASVGQGDAQSVSLASAALQSIVVKDRVKRASLTSSTPPAGISPLTPPLAQGEDASDSSTNVPVSTNMSESPMSNTPTPSSPPSPPPGSGASTMPPIGRGPPPALPPRRLRTAT